MLDRKTVYTYTKAVFWGRFPMGTFNGVACKKCGGTERYDRDKKCTACVRARDRARGKTPKRRAFDKKRSGLPHRKLVRERLLSERRNTYKDNEIASHRRDPRKKMLRSAKARAAKAGREFSISIDDVTIPARCPLLGLPLFIGTRGQKENSPTLDRKDSAKGYTSSNVWVVSWRANRLKADATLAELELIVHNLRKLH